MTKKRVGILYHPELPEAISLGERLAKELAEQDVTTWRGSAWKEDEARPQVPGSHLVVSIGGDGTILRVARAVVPWAIPIVGINLGKLGFIAEVMPHEASERLKAFLAGEGWIDERAMLQAELLSSSSGASETFTALNDVVVGRGAISRVITVETSIDGALLTTYKADGVLVATATGSTGYALACGGPILYPQAKEMLLKPIAPHLTLLKALVLAPASTVELKVSTNHQARLSLDGQVERPLQNGDMVRVRLSPGVARFLRAKSPAYFYETLRQRLTKASG